MPKQKRWTIKRNMDQAITHLDKAIDNLALAGHEFEAPHPDMYHHFAGIITGLDMLKSSVNTLKDSI